MHKLFFGRRSVRQIQAFSSPEPVRIRRKQFRSTKLAPVTGCSSASGGRTRNLHSARRRLAAQGRALSGGGKCKRLVDTDPAPSILSMEKARLSPAVETENPAPARRLTGRPFLDLAVRLRTARCPEQFLLRRGAEVRAPAVDCKDRGCKVRA